MTTIAANALTKNSLADRIEICQQKQFTGRLEITAKGDRQHWNLYFCLGRLIWATGGVHLIKRWQRLLAQYCPQVNSQKYVSLEGKKVEEYHLLIGLVKKQEIKGEEAVRVIRNTVTEVLFDLLQQETLGELTFVSTCHNALNASLTMLNPQHAVSYSKQAWEQWCKAGLETISPNAAVLLCQKEQLQKYTSPPVYKTLIKIVDGERTLRDLAVLMKQDLLLVTRLLSPYIRQGIMELIKIGDLLPPATGEQLEPHQPTNNFPTLPATPTSKQPLIACIDDSPIMGQLMKHILTKAGYRFVGISDALEALPVLLESQPDLIFLDLMMPIANGYEVCSQIRRITQFKNIPVIILTGNDGIVDRVRAKIVGSSEFLSKPIKPEQVLAVVRKYLPAPLAGNKVDT
ncbi:MAG: response regulator [Chroococcus sp. CMT-3BRIN-NPC107]|jgi:chemotaxis family two-component system response regulator PixG|nr:response regulator [Chroococcus sp. CMT-3BRIN-NPC107]